MELQPFPAQIHLAAVYLAFQITCDGWRAGRFNQDPQEYPNQEYFSMSGRGAVQPFLLEQSWKAKGFMETVRISSQFVTQLGFQKRTFPLLDELSWS